MTLAPPLKSGFNPMSPRDKMMSFKMVRTVDVSGVSGLGAVAMGAVFPDGHVALQWQSTVRSIAIYDSFAAVLAIHGHGNATGIVFDEDPYNIHTISGLTSSPLP